MPFISFFYKINDEPTKYYGKYCFDHISDDHEGLDVEVKYVLKSGINRHRVKCNLSKLRSNDIYVGVLSFSIDECIPTYSSNSEKQGFDFYYENTNGIKRTYLGNNVFYD
jgi:hypothetical protein